MQRATLAMAAPSDRNRVAAMVVRAIDQDAANAGVAHFAEADLGRAVRHGPKHSADQATSEAATLAALSTGLCVRLPSGAMLTA